jgi:hypothetical protein
LAIIFSSIERLSSSLKTSLCTYTYDAVLLIKNKFQKNYHAHLAIKIPLNNLRRLLGLFGLGNFMEEWPQVKRQLSIFMEEWPSGLRQQS